MPSKTQPWDLSLRFAQSTYGIRSLNETLPPYMALNYTLAPFKPQGDHRDDRSKLLSHGTHTASTTMYSVDLDCENGIPISDGSELPGRKFNTTFGCSWAAALDGNLTMGENKGYGTARAVKEYTGQYIGYHHGELADYYMGPIAPKSEGPGPGECPNNTFFASFAKSKVGEIPIFAPVVAGLYHLLC